MQYEYDKLTGAVKEFIQIMKESELEYFRVKNDKFELELGEKRSPMPPMPPVMAMPSVPAAPVQAAPGSRR